MSKLPEWAQTSERWARERGQEMSDEQERETGMAWTAKQLVNSGLTPLEQLMCIIVNPAQPQGELLRYINLPKLLEQLQPALHAQILGPGARVVSAKDAARLDKLTTEERHEDGNQEEDPT